MIFLDDLILMMLRRFIFFVSVWFISLVKAQTKAPLEVYRKESDRSTVLEHTKLKVSFDFKEKELQGEAWLTLRPYFYKTNTLVLDAKAMLIHNVQLEGVPLPYKYNGLKLEVVLPKAYEKEASYTLKIKYTARPEKVKQKGNSAINKVKGLYFVNTKSNDTGISDQVWTQGKTAASSCWFPTIDSPNQKTSQEIYMTVPNRFQTISNGTLENQTSNNDGTRTDYWNFKQKHAPYLFFMGVGEFSIIEDAYKNIPLQYYVTEKYAAHAKAIFGNTPEMMGFFSEILDVEYPWSTFKQLVGSEFMSPVMANTEAVIHGEQGYQVPGQLIDENTHENFIANGLFHHWFGNLVTAESWSNVTLNESFAKYGEYLWSAHKYGKDVADANLFEQVTTYKQGDYFDKSLVRYYYKDQEALVDMVDGNKGAIIIHMLRNYVGDAAFFGALKLYITKYRFQSAEVHQLRLAFEEVTGKDLNWFFNQWYFGKGHPNLAISYDYNLLEKKVSVNILQRGNVFHFPLTIDLIEEGKLRREKIFIDGKETSFVFQYTKEPEVILINADGVLLADIDEAKTTQQYIAQLKHARSYGLKKEAIDALAERQDDKKAFNAIANALSDASYKIRILAIAKLNLGNKFSKRAVIQKLQKIALQDKKTLVRAAAVEVLGKLIDPTYLPIFKESLKSPSYTVLGKTLVALYYVDQDSAMKLAKEIPNEVREIIALPLTRIFIESSDDTELSFIAKNVLSGMFLINDKRTKNLYNIAFEKIAKSNDTEAIQNVVADIVAKGKEFQKFDFDKTAVSLLTKMVEFQRIGEVPNRDRHIGIIRTAMTELIK